MLKQVETKPSLSLSRSEAFLESNWP